MNMLNNEDLFLQQTKDKKVSGTFKFDDHGDRLMDLDLSGVKFEDCKITGGDFASSVFTDCTFNKVTFRNSVLVGLIFKRCTFSECHFLNIEHDFNIEDSKVEKITFSS